MLHVMGWGVILHTAPVILQIAPVSPLFRDVRPECFLAPANRFGIRGEE